MITRNPNAPHTAVFGVEVQIMEKHPNGSLTGDPVEKKTFLFSIEGADQHICIRKVNELIEELTKRNPQ